MTRHQYSQQDLDDLLGDIEFGYPQNEINRVGFPEGQLMANGATNEQTAEISAAWHSGQPQPLTGDENLDRVAERCFKAREEW
ncbi:MAG: hypothetical protein U7123_08480 [Potamolinea sp.]